MIPSYLYMISFPTGSSYICNPPVLDTDIDVMHLVYDMEEVNKELLKDGWTLCGQDEYALGVWAAYRKDKLNALVTTSKKYFDKFFNATQEAKKLNLLKKEDRINLFAKYMT